MAQTPKLLRRAKKALDRGAYITAYTLARSYCEGSSAFDRGHAASSGIMTLASTRYSVEVVRERMAAVEAAARRARVKIQPLVAQFYDMAQVDIDASGVKWRDPQPRTLISAAESLKRWKDSL